VREVVRADFIYTVPSALVSPLTGYMLVEGYGLSWTTPWVLAGIFGYLLSTACWIPAAWLQVKMRDLAEDAVARGTALPEVFHLYNRVWLLLGVPAFVAAVFVIWSMVAKQVLPW
jgi:uncharacterized membrane protein